MNNDLSSLSMDAIPAQAMTVGVVCTIVSSLFLLIVMIKIFKKAGKPGWHAIIPILNIYDEFDIAEGKGVRFLLLLIPIFNIYVEIKFLIDFAKSFGKGAGFAVGLIFLSPIFLAILAFGGAKYVGPCGVPAAQAENE